MANQKLHAFEKTSIQARHTMKRLEAVIDNPRSTEAEKTIAQNLYDFFKNVRNEIPKEFQDVDLETKE